MTRRYHVYGLGNALVDMEFAVDDAFLARHGIAKGHMTLVDAERQLQLSGELSDHAPRRCSGGSAANTLMAVSAFGGTSFYSCKVADDDVGRFFVEDLRAAGVMTNAHEQHGEGISGQCIVLITPDAERSMNTFLGISGSLAREDVAEEALRNAECLYLEGYLCTSDSAREAVIHAREIARNAGVKLVGTLSDPSMVEFFRPQLASMMGERLDHLFCNEEEALGWTGAERLEDAVEALRTFSETFAITLGGRGSMIWDGNSLLKIDPMPVRPVDSTGAGDVYAGAYLYAMTHGHGHRQAGELASRAAGRLVARFGARLPFADHAALLAEA
ncbi:MAG: adenosine kinase [Pseudomonadales bacterium]|jgi:sugar/nucleoside kinase (ribokinase family)|nr:adenosine kinase [Pseudomonadales bacterium]